MASLNTFHSKRFGVSAERRRNRWRPSPPAGCGAAGNAVAGAFEKARTPVRCRRLPGSAHGHPEKYDRQAGVIEFKGAAGDGRRDGPTSDCCAAGQQDESDSGVRTPRFQSHAPLQIWVRPPSRSGQAAVDGRCAYVTPNASHAGIGFSATTGVAQPRYGSVAVLQNWVKGRRRPIRSCRPSRSRRRLR